MTSPAKRRTLIIGASGLLGAKIASYFAEAGDEVLGTYAQHQIDLPGVKLSKLDFSASKDITTAIRNLRPDLVIYAAGLSSVDGCDENEPAAHFLNADLPGAAATCCRGQGAKFVYISTDHLWDGKNAMMTETDPISPINAYARSKAAGEKAVMASDESALIVRTNFFGPGPAWRQSLSDWVISQLRNGAVVPAFADSYFTPIHMRALSAHLFDLIARGGVGLFHVAGKDRVSKLEFAEKICRAMGLSASLVKPALIKDADFLKAPRPLDMSLDTTKISTFLRTPMPSVEDGIRLLFEPSLKQPANLK